MAVDYHYYGRLFVSPVNMVLYNVVAGEGRGPALYGVEPLSFYLVNGFLNFPVGFPLALLSLPIVVRETNLGFSGLFKNNARRSPPPPRAGGSGRTRSRRARFS